jgi:predicted nuclease of predicted toxin-antitoxin system
LRILLDENLPEGIELVLQGLGHEVVHTRLEPTLRGSSDEQLAVIARRFDVFVTMDLHRQETEWSAVNTALIQHGIKVLRIRLPASEADVKVDIARSLITRMEAWIHEIESGKVLVTIRHLGVVASARTREEVQRMVEQRRADVRADSTEHGG